MKYINVHSLTFAKHDIQENVKERILFKNHKERFERALHLWFCWLAPIALISRSACFTSVFFRTSGNTREGVIHNRQLPVLRLQNKNLPSRRVRPGSRRFAIFTLDIYSNYIYFNNIILQQYLLFRRVSCVFETFTLGADKLQFVESFKYLGHLLTVSICDDEDTLKQIRAKIIIQQTCSLGNLLNVVCLLSYAFLGLIVPVLVFFGMSLWSRYNKSYIF